MGEQESEQARAAQLRKRALELRISGHSYREIAEMLAVPEPSAWKMVGVELQTLQASSHDISRRYRDEQLERLDAALRAIWPEVEAGKLDAIQCLLRIEERRSCLLGLDAVSAPVAGENGLGSGRAAKSSEAGIG
ncbi:hypothetical protein [Halochromatium sp.]